MPASYAGESSDAVRSRDAGSPMRSLLSAWLAARGTASHGLLAHATPACDVSECLSAPLVTGRNQIARSQIAAAVRAAPRPWLDGISTERT